MWTPYFQIPCNFQVNSSPVGVVINTELEEPEVPAEYS